MRAKQIIPYLPNPRNLRLVYTRITSSRLTTFFFAVAFIHFALQISFQSWAFSINASAGAFLSDILTAGGYPPHDNFAVLVPVSKDGQSGGELRICSADDIDGHRNIYQCPVAWKGRSADGNPVDSIGYEELAASAPGSSAPSTATSTPSRSITSAASTSSTVSQSPVSATSTSLSQTTPLATTSTPISRPLPPATNTPVPVRPVTNVVIDEPEEIEAPEVNEPEENEPEETDELEEEDDDDEEKEEDDDDDEDEEGDDDDDLEPSNGAPSGLAGGLANLLQNTVKRDHKAQGVSRRALWRRSIPVISVLQADPEGVAGVPQSTFNSNVSVVGVMLPQMINSTTGRAGVLLSEQCVQMILWPNQMVHNTKREDVTFLAFQFWVLGMSIVAILNESIPHILAALLTHVLATTWSAFQLTNTANFREEFIRSTIGSGRCGGVNLLPGYWNERRGAEVAVLVVNAVSLVATAFLSWRLIKMFGWQTFKRIGASITINRVYKIVLVFSIGLQLAFFFILTLLGLWLDNLFNTVLGRTVESGAVYKAFSILACILLVPWLYLGWFSVRRETKRLMYIFLGFSLLFLAGWGSLFACMTFRWMFLEWRFFAAMAVSASLLLICTTILGVVCFFNFGKGLKTFLLDGQEEQLARDEFERVYSREVKEKSADIVGFPGSGPIPTYAVAFGNHDQSDGRSHHSNSSFSSGGVGSPLHDPESFPPMYTQSTMANLPPRFQMQTQANGLNPYTGFAAGGPAVARAITATTTDSSEDNPFHLEHERRDKRGSVGSGNTVVSAASKNTYVTPGSHHVPNAVNRHVQDGNQGSWNAKKGWVIE